MRLLFVTSNRVGDAVLSSGILRHLLEVWPDLRPTVAAGPAAAPLFAATPRLEELIAMPKRRRAGHWLALWRRVAGRRWDVVVDLRGSALAYLLRADRRLVKGRDPAHRHRVEALGDLLGLPEPPAPRLWIGTDQRQRAAALMPEDDTPILALGPTANWPAKVWPGENFVALAERLTGPDGILPGARIAVLGAGFEREQAAPVLEGLPADRLIDLVGGADLASLHACLARCSFFVGNDSGLMHLAAAAGVPTLGLFGPSRPEHYAPWGPHGAAIRTPESYEQLTGAPDYDHRTVGNLMGGLDVDSVEAAARELHRRLKDPAA